MNFKEKLMRMTLWKVVLSVFLIMVLVSVVFEEILSHTVFKVIDRTLVTMEKEAIDDRADMDEMEKREQQDYCEKYEEVNMQKEFLIKNKDNILNFDFKMGMLKDDEIDIEMAVKNHSFNPAHCKREKL